MAVADAGILVGVIVIVGEALGANVCVKVAAGAIVLVGTFVADAGVCKVAAAIGIPVAVNVVVFAITVVGGRLFSNTAMIAPIKITPTTATARVANGFRR